MLLAETFLETSYPVVEYYKEKGKVVEVCFSRESSAVPSCDLLSTQVDGTKTIDEVYAATKASVKARLGLP